MKRLLALHTIEIELIRLKQQQASRGLLQEGIGELSRLRSEESDREGEIQDLVSRQLQIQKSLEACRERLLNLEIQQKKTRGSSEARRAGEQTEELRSQGNGLELRQKRLLNTLQAAEEALRQVRERRVRVERVSPAAENECLLPQPSPTPQIAEMESLKNRILERFSPGQQELYRRVAALKDGTGVAKLSGLLCSGCNMVLPAQFVAELRKHQAIQQCLSCRRFLALETGS